MSGSGETAGAEKDNEREGWERDEMVGEERGLEGEGGAEGGDKKAEAWEKRGMSKRGDEEGLREKWGEKGRGCGGEKAYKGEVWRRRVGKKGNKHRAGEEG